MHEQGEIMVSLFGACPHLIVVEGDIHGPVQAVRDRPVRAYSLPMSWASAVKLVRKKRCSRVVLPPMVRSDSSTAKLRNPCRQ